MSEAEIKKQKKKSLFQGLFAALMVFALVVMSGFRIAMKSATKKALEESNERLEQIDAAMAGCLKDAESFAGLVAFDGGEMDDFDAMAKKIIRDNPYYYNIQLAPDGFVSQTYPLIAQDHWESDLITLYPEQVDKAIQTGKPFISGPFSKKAGMMIMIHQPVFLDENDPSSFWGFANIAVNAGDLMKAYGISTEAGWNDIYSLTAESQGEEAVISGGSPTGVVRTIALPGTVWRLYARPTIAKSRQILIFSTALLLFFLSFTWTRRRAIHQN